MRTLMFCAVLAISFPAFARSEDPGLILCDGKPCGAVAILIESSTTEKVTPAFTPTAPGTIFVDESGGALPDVVEEIKPGEEIDWAIKTASALQAAASEKLWGLFASIAIMALLSLFSFVFLRFRDLRTTLRPYMGEVALAVSVLGYIAIGLGTLPAGADLGEWWGVIGPGLKTGLAAVGSYEILLKRVIKIWLPKIWVLLKHLFSKKM